MSSPEPDVDSGSDFSLLGRLWPWLKPDAWALALALVLTPLVAGLKLAQPLLVKTAIDEHIVPGTLEGLQLVAGGYLLAVFGAWLTEATYGLSFSWAGERTIVRLRLGLYRQVLSLSQRFFDSQPAGRLLTRITSDVDSLGEAIAAGSVTIFLDILLILGISGAMIWLDWRLSLLMLVLTPPLFLVLELMRRRLKGLYGRVREAQAELNAFMAERIDGIRVLQTQGGVASARRGFRERNSRFATETKTANIYDAAMFAVVDGSSRIFVAVALWWGVGEASAQLGIQTEPASVGLLVAFMDYLDRIFRPLRELSGKVTIIQRALSALAKLFWLLDVSDKVPSGGRELPEVRGHLQIRDLRFRYRADQAEILKGIDLELLPGQSLAVVGATGSGKTTLSRLLDRSYEGYQGSIHLDGVELKEISLSSLRRSVAAVRQDIQLFSDTLGFNVDLDNPTIDSTRREEAARLTRASQVVEQLGWEHPLRERGANLSVGQGQLVTFARAMAHRPGLLILDEATASVDSLTEALIQEAIGNMLAQRTVIIIAHRLSTVQRADRIAVMDGGRILELGTHAELLARGGAYAALVAAGEGLLGHAPPAVPPGGPPVAAP